MKFHAIGDSSPPQNLAKARGTSASRSYKMRPMWSHHSPKKHQAFDPYHCLKHTSCSSNLSPPKAWLRFTASLPSHHIVGNCSCYLFQLIKVLWSAWQFQIQKYSTQTYTSNIKKVRSARIHTKWVCPKTVSQKMLWLITIFAVKIPIK